MCEIEREKNLTKFVLSKDIFFVNTSWKGVGNGKLYY